jgi:hypothetical protein
LAKHLQTFINMSQAPASLSPEAALAAIQAFMSRNEWDADTIEYVAEIMKIAGYPIADLDEES